MSGLPLRQKSEFEVWSQELDRRYDYWKLDVVLMIIITLLFGVLMTGSLEEFLKFYFALLLGMSFMKMIRDWWEKDVKAFLDKA